MQRPPALLLHVLLAGCTVPAADRAAPSEGEEIAPPSHCQSGLSDGDETDADCGGSCPPCLALRRCITPGDCVEGVCLPELQGGVLEGRCQAPRCDDGVANGGEIDVDCGTADCPRCSDGLACKRPDQCASGVCAGALCSAPTCADRVANGGEGDVDCGGDCAPCSDGKSCRASAGCASGRCASLRCTAATCSDGLRDGRESDIDCGGPDCPRCNDRRSCSMSSDCTAATCRAGVCAALSCADHLKSGSESDIDCGGTCPERCAAGLRCVVDGDCVDRACRGKLCAAPTCGDGIRNGKESDRDCGGPLAGSGLAGTCPRCGPGRACLVAGDCASGACTGGLCASTCGDLVQGGSESDVNCGGGLCSACADGARCTVAADCASRVCQAGLCKNPGCADGVQSGVESDLDCGGSCGRCQGGRSCLSGADCASGVCAGRTCRAATCSDGTQNGGESDRDCGGPCAPCTVGAGCGLGVDCAGGVCTDGRCAPPASCRDGRPGEGEADRDCGGPCESCGDGRACRGDGDCASGACEGGRCAGSCTDHLRDGRESDLDCGGGRCPRCGHGLRCASGSDCRSGLCLGRFCRARSCAGVREENPKAGSGAYQISLDGATAITVFCEMLLDGGGWTVVSIDGDPLRHTCRHRLREDAPGCNVGTPPWPFGDWQLPGVYLRRIAFREILLVAYSGRLQVPEAMTRLVLPAPTTVGDGRFQVVPQGVTTPPLGCHLSASLAARTRLAVSDGGFTVWGEPADTCPASGGVGNHLGIGLPRDEAGLPLSGWAGDPVCGCTRGAIPGRVPAMRGLIGLR
ncbi:MAG: hypothetical protein EXR72_06070 [Myxococcales bacterium]|nr:hypothetical protein [Myxococcales bacterium]